MNANASRMDRKEYRPVVRKWPQRPDKENARPLPNMHNNVKGWLNRDGCTSISEKQERKVLKECVNIQAGTIPSTKQQSKKNTTLQTNVKSKFRATPVHKSARRQTRKAKAQTKDVYDASVPSYVVIRDESMEVLEGQMFLTQLTSCKLPSGVDDSDSHTNVFLCPEYACDIIHYLQRVEARWKFPASFLENDTEVTPSMRAILMDWLNQVQNHENLNEESLHLAVAMIDRYNSIHKLKLPLLQLLGITCLLIAAKYIERFPPEISTLCKLTDDSYTVSAVLEMEIMVLKSLQFDLNIPTPITFLRRFIGTQACATEEYQLSEYLLDLCLTSHQMVYCPASLLAASSLYIARLIFGSDMIWTPTLAYYTTYVKRDLRECVFGLSRILARAETRDLQGARTKFSSSSRGTISKHEILKNNIDLMNASKGILPSKR